MLKDCKDLKELMKKYPELPVYFLAHECSHSGNYRYEPPHEVTAVVEEILNTDTPTSDETYTDRNRFEEDLWDMLVDENEFATEKEISGLFEQQLDKYYEPYWEKCIVVYLD